MTLKHTLVSLFCMLEFWIRDTNMKKSEEMEHSSDFRYLLEIQIYTQKNFEYHLETVHYSLYN